MIAHLLKGYSTKKLNLLTSSAEIKNTKLKNKLKIFCWNFLGEELCFYLDSQSLCTFWLLCSQHFGIWPFSVFWLWPSGLNVDLKMKSSFLAFVSTVSEIIWRLKWMVLIWNVLEYGKWNENNPVWVQEGSVFPNKKYKQPKTVKKQKMFFSIITKMSNGLFKTIQEKTKIK